LTKTEERLKVYKKNLEIYLRKNKFTEENIGNILDYIENLEEPILEESNE
jgi:hypothetical protein